MVSRILILVALFFPVAAQAGQSLEAVLGKALFNRNWVAAPSTTQNNAGLGPLYNARSCNACHAGAGPAQISSGYSPGMVVRLGNAHGAPDLRYGAQLQTQSLPGLNPEASLYLNWVIQKGLHRPLLKIERLNYGKMDAKTQAGFRRPPSLFGLAALASVPEKEVLAVYAQEKANGIAGHPAWREAAKSGKRLGRWGWKASSADLEDQISLAMQRDIGISTNARPNAAGDCTKMETRCLAMTGSHNQVEASDAIQKLIYSYLNSLPPPTPPNSTMQGAVAFQRIGCGGCHRALRNSAGEPVNAYTDLLLHDLGSDLSDGIREGTAKPSEWRTAPLWNVPEELRLGGLLHDGRARSIAEAVAWHGGTAAKSRARFAALSPADKNAIARFLLKE